MGELDVDLLLLSVGPDLPYLTGYEAMPLSHRFVADPLAPAQLPTWRRAASGRHRARQRTRQVSKDIGRRLVAEGHHRINFAIVGSGPARRARTMATGRVIRRARSSCGFGGTMRPGPAAAGIGYCSDIRAASGPAAQNRPAVRDLYAVLLKHSRRR
jgi:hypothetical protein